MHRVGVRSKGCLNRLGANTIMAFFTGVLVIVACAQVWIAIVNQRAFLSLDAVGLKRSPLAPGQPEIVIQIRNSGHAAAFIKEATVTIQVTVAAGLPQKPRYEPLGKVSIVNPLVAGGSSQMTFSPKTARGGPFLLDDNAVRQILQGDWRLYVFGFVQYRDMLKIFSHVTGFCAVYKPDNDPSFGMFGPCEETPYQYGS